MDYDRYIWLMGGDENTWLEKSVDTQGTLNISAIAKLLNYDPDTLLFGKVAGCEGICISDIRIAHKEEGRSEDNPLRVRGNDRCIWLIGGDEDSWLENSVDTQGTLNISAIAKLLNYDPDTLLLGKVAGRENICISDIRIAHKEEGRSEDNPLLVMGRSLTSGHQYGLPEDQVKVLKELATFLYEERKKTRTIHISSISQTTWMDVQQDVGLDLSFPPEDKIIPTHLSDFPSFGWDDRVERSQADRYIPYLKNIKKSRKWTMIDAANKNPTLLSCNFRGRCFSGTTDVAWADRRSVHLIPQSGLRCLFELKKTITKGPSSDQFQALICLILANILSTFKPFSVLTNLDDWWVIYWIDGSCIYQHLFESRAHAVGYIEDLLTDDGDIASTSEGGSLLHDRQDPRRIFKRKKLYIPEMEKLSELAGFLPDEEIQAAQAHCALSRLFNILAVASMRSELPESMYL